MTHRERQLLIEKLITTIEELLPSYMANPDDFAISNGVASVCIIDESGTIYGKLFGEDKIAMRNSYKIAWTKANQVWITGIKTLDFERMVYANQVDIYQFGLNMPELLGWEGGQPIKLDDGSVLSIGFSGFRGTSDIEIVLKALEKADIRLLE